MSARTYRIKAERTPRGALTLSWPTDAQHDRLISALADELEDEMTDRALRRVTLTIEVEQ